MKSKIYKQFLDQNIFDVTQKHSKSTVETLKGTNNFFWYCYFEDINLSFKVMKVNKLIMAVEKGSKKRVDGIWEFESDVLEF